MTNLKVPALKVPTQEQLTLRLDELVADAEARRLNLLRTQLEGQAMAELSAELNHGRADALAAQAALDRGMSFLKDVWPDHPAAGATVGDPLGGSRPVGVRAPFRLEPDGVWFVDYWVSSPLFPAGRAADGAVVLAFRVGDGWRESLLSTPAPTHGTHGKYGFEGLRSFGLKVNPESLRGNPELEIGGTLLDLGDRAVVEGRVRTAEELLWRFVNATQNEVLSAVSA